MQIIGCGDLIFMVLILLNELGIAKYIYHLDFLFSSATVRLLSSISSASFKLVTYYNVCPSTVLE